MPAITNSSATILVTGANGFVASWIVEYLLRRGYSVRIAVRNEAKAKHLLEIFKSYGDKLQLCVVGDIGGENVFDEAVKDVDGIIHTASPVTVAVEPRDYIEPAIQGTVGLLSSALKNGSSLQRIVITSSAAAIFTLFEDDGAKSEANWNDAAVAECEEKGKDAPNFSKYYASKTLAEKSAWDFYEKHKSEINWDLTITNCTYIFGPMIHEVVNIDTVSMTCKMWYNAMIKGDFGGFSPLITPGYGWLDVRDAAEAHVRALEIPAASRERIIVSAEVGTVWQDWLDLANSLSTSYPSRTFAKGTPGTVHRGNLLDTSKAKRILDMKFRTKEETMRDILADYERRRW